MTINYSTLIDNKFVSGSIKNWVNYSEIPAEDILTEVESEVYKRLRVKEMIQATTGSMAIGDEEITVPANFRESYKLVFTGTHKADLVKKTIGDVTDAWGYDGDGNRVTGKPCIYAEIDGALMFDTKAAAAYPWHLRYYGSLDPLAEENETNFLTTRYPSILRHGCMYIAYEFLRRPEMHDKHFQLFEKAIFEANQESDRMLLGAELEMYLA